jgi:hypothetical protein
MADYTCVLTPLTTKDTRKSFPEWTLAHQATFEAIKALVISAKCLTSIDHEHPGDNKNFVVCNTSNWCIGMTLSFGLTWETSHPVAFDSLQLKLVEKNYPVHGNKLLAIICALKNGNLTYWELIFMCTLTATLWRILTQKRICPTVNYIGKNSCHSMT